MPLFLNKEDYTVKNALVWGNFKQHVKQTKKGSLGHRVIHILIAGLELFPVVSQIASLVEKGLFAIAHKTIKFIPAKNKPTTASKTTKNEIKKTNPSDVSGKDKIKISEKNVIHSKKQPEIEQDDWGTITIKADNGVTQTFKDVVILPNRAFEWNWKWDGSDKKQGLGMSHRPGVRRKDLDALILPSQPDIVILTQGRGHGGRRDNPGPGILEINPSLIKYLKQHGIKEIHVAKTLASIQTYNEMRRKYPDKKIAALIHTTC